jgi:hypothetical protein
LLLYPKLRRQKPNMRLLKALKLAALISILPAFALAAEPPQTAETQSTNSPTAATPPAISQQTISQWVSQLGSDSYTVREGASDELIRAGRASIDAMVAATRQDDLEVTTRAVHVLAALLKSNEAGTADAAADALAKVAAVRNASTAAMAAAGSATDALGDFEQLRQEQTLAEIRRLGGKVTNGAADPFRNPDGIQIILESEWHGGSAGMKLLKHVPNLQYLSVHGVAMTDADLVQLQGLTRLVSVELFGTKVSMSAARKFAQAHPAAKIDRRGNAKLGIACDASPCLITVVQPGSGADQAGLMPGDVVQKFQGRVVNDFAGLTAAIGACTAGDKVTLEISRDGETLRKEATLGEWK